MALTKYDRPPNVRECVSLAPLRICFCFFPYLIFFQRRQRVVAERSVSQTGCENILLNENPSCFICFQSNNKKKKKEVAGRALMGSVVLEKRRRAKWILELFASLPSSSSRHGEPAERLLQPGLVHWDHVCGGAPHPGGAHGLLCAEKQRWQVCRYAAAQATGHVPHGERSVRL